MFEFIGQKREDLSLKKGDVVVILERAVNGDRGWWRGRLLSSGTEGGFPSNYVLEDSPLESATPPPPRPRRDISKRASVAVAGTIPLNIPVPAAPAETPALNPFMALPTPSIKPVTTVRKPVPQPPVPSGGEKIAAAITSALPSLPAVPAFRPHAAKAPTTTGSLIQKEDFRQIDQFARTTPESECKDIQSLASFLVGPCSTVIETYRAFFVWITCFIDYDVEAYLSGNLGDQSAEKTFKTRKGVCTGFSNLFRKMCKSANLDCDNVQGHGKGLTGLRMCFSCLKIRPCLSANVFLLFRP